MSTRGRYPELPDIVRIRRWAVLADGGLEGRVDDHPEAPVNTRWSTTPVIGVRGKLAVTASGSHYYLGEARSEAQWAILTQRCPNVRLPR